jgi:hypothetical protein
MYEAATDSNDSIVIGKKATAVTYTGPLTGGPNKSITLSAILKDATGKPLVGKAILFVLGTAPGSIQQLSGTTGANGQATAVLKLALKNGTYSLSATYTPSVPLGDSNRYIGSSSSVTFKLQAK